MFPARLDVCPEASGLEAYRLSRGRSSLGANSPSKMSALRIEFMQINNPQ